MMSGASQLCGHDLLLMEVEQQPGVIQEAHPHMSESLSSADTDQQR